ncbi:MAG: hypothetical protein Q7T85_01165 [Nitrosomonas sp.]|nr:hypothetical protein [Nitrosomonas sp.]
MAAISAITARDVARIDCIERLVAFLNAGTTTKPPPTPNNSDKNPVAIPENANARAHGQIHTKRPCS